MVATFSTLIEQIQNLPPEEQLELRDLLDKYLTESRREEIFQHYLDAKKLSQTGELTFTSNIEELRRSLEE